MASFPKLNFGAANLRSVDVELSDKSFVSGTSRLTPDVLKSFGKILPLLDQEPSILRVIYMLESDSKTLARNRLAETEALLNRAWKSRHRVQALSVETKLSNQ